MVKSRNLRYAFETRPYLNEARARRVYTKIKSNKVSEFIELTLEWCRANLGENQSARFDVDVYYEEDLVGDMTKGCYGEYDASTCSIYIRMSKHRVWQSLANTIIHEWCHYLQNAGWYTRYQNNGYTYKEHPYEKEASYVARKLSAMCTEHVLRKMKEKRNV